MNSVEKRLHDTEARMAKLEDSELFGELPPAISAKFSAMEEEIANLKKRGFVPVEEKAISDHHGHTMIVGGLSLMDDFTEADKWARDALWKAWGQQPIEVYCKGDFRQIIFVKFESKADRDRAVKLLSSAAKHRRDGDI